MQKIISSLLLSLLTAFCLAAPEPAAVWNFDNGKNVDTESGTTEFTRTSVPVFPGLKSAGTSPVQLLASPKVDTSSLFEAVPRGVAMRTGMDEASGAVFGASGKLPFTISKKEGAIAFWMRAEDWDGNERGKFHIMVAADDGATPRSNELLIYKHKDMSTIRFLIGNNDFAWSTVEQSISKWKRGEWHFVCASWTPNDLTLLLDDKALQVPRPGMPAKDYSVLHLGTRNWKLEGGLTILDDVNVFTRALKREEMDALRVQTRPVTNERTAPLTHRLGISKPVLDGKINSFEYGASLNSTWDLESGELSAASRWAFARDDKNIYFACETIAPIRNAAITTRDGNVWEDESVEVHLECQGRQWQFVINANGVIYDSQDHNSKWNATGMQLKQAQQNGRWTIEMALPFETLGISSEEGSFYYFTIGRSVDLSVGHTAATPLLRRFIDRANYIKAVLDRNAPPVEFTYHELPATEGKLVLAAFLPPGFDTSLWLLGCDTRERKLYENTAVSVEKNGRTQVQINGTGLTKDGSINYKLTVGGLDIAEANFKYLSPEKLKLHSLLVPNGTQKLETTLALTPPIAPAQKVIQTLKGKDGQVVLRQETTLNAEQSTKYKAVVTWDLTQLEPGTYDYYLSIPIDSDEKILHHQYFQKPAAVMPWTNFDGGIDTETPIPWHAPWNVNDTLVCLTQVYDFGGLLFPSRILAQGRDVLSAPVTLRLNGRILKLPAKWELLESNALETRFRTTAVAEGISFTVNGVLEYDGWMRLAMTYASAVPQKPVTVKDLALVLPMNAEHSSMVSSFIPQYAAIQSGKLGVNARSDIMEHPVFWLGNADRGLFWGADSMRGTRLTKTDDTLRITRKDENSAATAVVKLVDSAFTLTTPRTFEFGLQGTPVKPVKLFPKPWMFRGGDTITTGPPWQFFHIFNYANPEFIDKEKAKRMVIDAKRRTPIFAIYASVYGASPFCPEWAWHYDAWGSFPPEPGQFKYEYASNNEYARNQSTWAFGCVANQEFMNWQLYDKNLLIQDKEVNMKDMYIDMGYPRACHNPHHGCAWKDDFGRIRKTYPINANRTFTKRLRKLLRDKNKDSVLIYHSSTETLPPVCGLADFTVEGEVYMAEIAKAENYYDLLTPELVQAAYSGARTGTSVIMVSQLNRAAMIFNPGRSEYWRRKVKTPEAVRAVRHFLGYCLLHDIRPQAGAGIYNEGAIIEKQLYSVGYGDGNYDYHPYWSSNNPVVCNGGKPMVSAFAFSGGKTLAVALNDEHKLDARVTLALKSGRKPARIYDLESGKDITFPITIPPKGFRLIVFQE